MEQKIEIEIQVLATFCRGTGQVCHLKLIMKADMKKSFFQHDQVFAKVSFTQQKTYIFFFFKTKCKNAPGVAGAVLQTVTD